MPASSASQREKCKPQGLGTLLQSIYGPSRSPGYTNEKRTSFAKQQIDLHEDDARRYHRLPYVLGSDSFGLWKVKDEHCHKVVDCG